MIIIFVILIIALLVLYAIDFFFYMKNWFSRYHIGRMNDEEWEKAVKKIAKKWVIHTPVVKKNDNSRYILIDMLNGEYRDSSIQAFQTASLLLGLEETSIDFCVSHFIKKGTWIEKPTKPDSAMLAYALLKNTENPSIIKNAMDEVYKILQEATDEYGLIAYTGDRNDPSRYVDVLGMVCPFLAKYGSTYNINEAIAQSFSQLEFYHSYGMFPGTVLPNHAIDVITKYPLGVYGWGRGTAWYLIGLLDTYEVISHDYKDILLEWIDEAARYYMKFQHRDGGFGCILQRDKNYDSSVTAAMAWFYLKCAELFGNPDYTFIADCALKKLKSVTRRNGAIDWSQGDTKGIGIFSQTFDIMPFTQGFALRAIALKDRITSERT